MKFNGYICIYLYALYTNTISSSISVGKLHPAMSFPPPQRETNLHTLWPRCMVRNRQTLLMNKRTGKVRIKVVSKEKLFTLISA